MHWLRGPVQSTSCPYHEPDAQRRVSPLSRQVPREPWRAPRYAHEADETRLTYRLVIPCTKNIYCAFPIFDLAQRFGSMVRLFQKIAGAKGVNMRRSFSIEETQFETQRNEGMTDSQPSFPAKSKDCHLGGVIHGLEILLTSKETSQILRIHPKVVERMAQRGEIPALKVGKFWRYRATALDAWINSKLQPEPRCNSVRGQWS